MIRSLIGRLQGPLSRCNLLLRVLGKTSNQYDMLRSRSLQRYGPQPKVDREQWLLESIPGGVSRVVDVGANVGEWTRMARETDGWQVADYLLLEALEANVRRLEGKFSGCRQIRIVHTAVGDAPGLVKLNYNTDNNKTPSLALRPEGTNASELVSVVRLDEKLPELGWSSVDYLKIDTEGFDLHVLRGAENLLRSRSISALQFEYLGGSWRSVRSTLGEAMNLLENRCGWKCWLVGAGCLLDFDYEEYAELLGTFTFFAVPQETSSRYENLLK
jgi:FkbM family methyltransferase